MQCVSKDYPTSFVITDPKGSLIGEVGQLLQRSGYRVKVLNIPICLLEWYVCVDEYMKRRLEIKLIHSIVVALE